MQPETAQQRRPDPWPFGPVHGSDGPAGPPVTEPPVTEPAVHPAVHPAAYPAAHPRVEPGLEPAAGEEARAEADELVARLRARRSTAGVAAAYAAAHGHPADPRAEHGARRWALTGTTAVVAVVAVLLLGVGVAVLSMRGEGVEVLAPALADEGPADESASPFAEGDSGPARSSDAAGSDAAAAGAAAAGGGLLVHVVGEVVKPGLVTLPDGARVADAVKAAGGVTRKADLTAVNLARTVVDGEQLYVPKPGESAPGSPVPGAPSTPGADGQGASGGQPGASGGAVDINTADAMALEALPGVGPSIAQAIVEWRETNGPFASVDELEDVPGIGPATLDEIRAGARVGP